MSEILEKMETTEQSMGITDPMIGPTEQTTTTTEQTDRMIEQSMKNTDPMISPTEQTTRIPKLVLSDESHEPLSPLGLVCLDYLAAYHPEIFTSLLLSEQLYQMLSDMQSRMQELIENVLKEYVSAETERTTKKQNV
ncbi:MAG: TnpV protein [Lachnospiraceae bacterium]|nr:TnpV protein [Lachnospiraceae bacterium]